MDEFQDLPIQFGQVLKNKNSILWAIFLIGLGSPHPASGALLLLARFWRSLERLCMNRVRSLLNMRCTLPG